MRDMFIMIYNIRKAEARIINISHAAITNLNDLSEKYRARVTAPRRANFFASEENIIAGTDRHHKGGSSINVRMAARE